MLNWLIFNAATILISVLLLGIVIWISLYLHKKKSSGFCPGCGGGCQNCGHLEHKK